MYIDIRHTLRWRRRASKTHILVTVCSTREYHSKLNSNQLTLLVVSAVLIRLRCIPGILYYMHRHFPEEKSLYTRMIAVYSVLGRSCYCCMYCLTGTRCMKERSATYLIAYSWWCCMRSHRLRTRVVTWIRCRENDMIRFIVKYRPLLADCT